MTSSQSHGAVDVLSAHQDGFVYLRLATTLIYSVQDLSAWEITLPGATVSGIPRDNGRGTMDDGGGDINELMKGSHLERDIKTSEGQGNDL